MKVFVISSLSGGDVSGVFSSPSSTRDYLIDKKKVFPLMKGAYITVFELDKGMIWHGNWEWVDGELKTTDGEYVYKNCDTCGKTRKVVDLDSIDRCHECLGYFEEGDAS